MYHRTLIEDGTLTVPRSCQDSTIKVSVTAKDEQWTLEKPLPSNQAWNPAIRQITQVRYSLTTEATVAAHFFFQNI